MSLLKNNNSGSFEKKRHGKPLQCTRILTAERPTVCRWIRLGSLTFYLTLYQGCMLSIFLLLAAVDFDTSKSTNYTQSDAQRRMTYSWRNGLKVDLDTSAARKRLRDNQLTIVIFPAW